MILTNEIKISIHSRNRKYYQKLLKTNLVIGDNIIVSVDKLSKFSHSKIDIQCDFCDNKRNITIQSYYSLLDSENKYSCSECAKEKRKKNNFIKYGVENVFQLDSVKEKLKETNNEKYGCDNPQQNKEIHERTLLTNIEKYGCDNPSRNKDIIQKIKDVQFERYGCWYNQTEECIEKKIKNNNIKYGVDWTMQLSSVIDKGIKTSFKIENFNDIKYQGSYELDFLQKCKELNLLDKLSSKITIEYFIDDKKHTYHPDFYFKEYNLLIEIKSSFTYKLHEEKCDAKTNRCIELGYNYIMITNKKYEEFFEFLKNKNIKNS